MKTKDYLEWASQNLDTRIKNSNFKKELHQYYQSLIIDVAMLKEQLTTLQMGISKEVEKINSQ